MILEHTSSHHTSPTTATGDQPDERRIADLRVLDERISKTRVLLHQLRDQKDRMLSAAGTATLAAYTAETIISREPIVFVPADDLSQESSGQLDYQRQLNSCRRISPREQGEMETMQAAHESHHRRLAQDASEPGRDYME